MFILNRDELLIIMNNNMRLDLCYLIVYKGERHMVRMTGNDGIDNNKGIESALFTYVWGCQYGQGSRAILTS